MRIFWMISLFLGAGALAESFSLKDQATGELSGPYNLLPGEVIKLGTNEYSVVLRSADNVDVRSLMASIQIKALEFRETDVRDVIEFLRETSRKEDPSGVGINFIMLPFKKADVPSGVVAGDRHARVTMNLRDVSLFDALLLVKNVTGYEFHIKNNTIFIQPK